MKNKKITNERQCGWINIKEEEKKLIFSFCDEYIEFLNKGKTEREVNKLIIEYLTQNGYKNIININELKPGDKVYYNNRKKSVYAAVIGSDDIATGLNIIGTHIDSPRLDLKPNPIYEDSKLALFKTHYYGGIKKYQWTTIPLSMHGVIIKTDGTKIDINIGENEDDPIFTITDLLPHLSQKQNTKNLAEAIEGENLNILIGSIPDGNNSIKNNILNILYEKYNIREIDFSSAEIEFVPAFKAKSLGLDKSMIAGYGQDDRVCAYSLLKGLIDSAQSKKTQVAIFADKEEIGSVGNTGMYSDNFDNFINEIIKKRKNNELGILTKIYCNSKMLSADVGAGVDPNYKDVSEDNNASFIGYGVELNKYTGSKGKSGASDANAEFVAYVRNLLEENNIKYQVSELGKVDLGGGGTIAYILANKGIDVIDCGVPVISMHSPYEVTSKFDIYQAYEIYKVFLESNENINY